MATINLLKGCSNLKLSKASKIEPLRNPRIYNSAATTRLTPLYPHIELSTPDEPISHERNPHEHTTSTHSIPLRRLNTKRRSSSVLTTVSSPDGRLPNLLVRTASIVVSFVEFQIEIRSPIDNGGGVSSRLLCI